MKYWSMTLVILLFPALSLAETLLVKPSVGLVLQLETSSTSASSMRLQVSVASDQPERWHQLTISRDPSQTIEQQALLWEGTVTETPEVVVDEVVPISAVDEMTVTLSYRIDNQVISTAAQWQQSSGLRTGMRQPSASRIEAGEHIIRLERP